MTKEHLPIYQIQDFRARSLQENYFYLSSLALHLQKHQFIQKPHKHNFYILLFITRGTGTHTIDFREYPVVPHMVFFLTPGQVHSWNLSDDTDGYVVFFTSEYYQQEFPHKKLFRFPFFNALLSQPWLFVSPGEEAGLSQVIGHLQQEVTRQELMHTDMLLLHLEMLLIRLNRLYQAQVPGVPAGSGPGAQLQQLENLIDQHYKDHLPVQFYADQLFISVRQLNQACRRSLNKTFSDLIRDRILLEARRLLVHSGLTSSQVAAELGYMDVPYFFRFFKKHTGITPEQFRAAQK